MTRSILLFWLTLCVAIMPGQSAAEDDLHISASTEFYALHKYPALKGHKAIATGPQGFWSAYYADSSVARVKKAALAACNGILRTSKFKRQRSKKCVLFDVDGKRTGNAPPVGIPFGTVATGPDLPWQFGKEWEATGSGKRGTMLMLHGCDGMGSPGPYTTAWVSYYRAQGFRVIMPNSFAELRDPDSCPPLGEDAVDKQTRNLKLRVAQTLRTIAGVKEKYPGERIYVHGQSEGGAVAQALGADIDGIIVTGATCGFGYSDYYHVGKGVPVLVIAGTQDPWFTEAKTAKGLARFCRKVTGNGPLKLVSVTGMDHFPATWWPTVEAAVSQFLKVPSIKIGRPSAKGVTYPKFHQSYELERYQAGRRHKAVAANQSGKYYWTTGANSQLVAEEEALFGCDGEALADPYLNRVHSCALVEVNGKRLTE